MAAPREIPLKRALRRTKTKPKMWRDLLEAGFLTPAYSAGSPRRYVISEDQYERLRLIERARRKIHGRFTLGKLGFELATAGSDFVPVKVLRKESLKRIDGYLGLVKRTAQRYTGLSPKVNSVTDSAVFAAAKRLAKRLTRKLPPLKQVAAYSVCYLVASLVLRVMYVRKASPLQHVHGIKEQIIHYMTADSPDRGHVGLSYEKVREIASMLAGSLDAIRGVIALDRHANTLYVGVQAGDEAAFQRAFSAEDLVNNAMRDFFRDLRQFVKVPQFDDETWEVLRSLCLATLVSFQAEAPRSEVLQELLSGSDRLLRKALSQLVSGIRDLIRLQPLLESFRKGEHAA